MTPKKDDYMRGYHDGFKDGSAEMLASLKDAANRLRGAGMLSNTDEILAAISKAEGTP